MSPEELKKITEPFYMADKSVPERKAGVGLGLVSLRVDRGTPSRPTDL